MSGRSEFLTLMVHRDGDLRTRSIRIPVWAARLSAGVGAVLALAIVVGVALYVPVVRRAARVSGLERDVARLEAENASVTQLAAKVEELEGYYGQFRSMLGADLVPSPTAAAGSTLVGAAVVARVPGSGERYPDGPSLPLYEPVAGFVTQGLSAAGGGKEIHTGLDIAVPMGTPIRAAGGGVVSQSGYDPEYGMFVQIDHPRGYQSMYGHASRVLVRPGQRIRAGQVIGLTGSTGRSTAPHLHFEVLKDGAPVDPQTIKEGGI